MANDLIVDPTGILPNGMRWGKNTPIGRSNPAGHGLEAWYRFNQGITVTGQGVSQWDDQSGNGNHLLQATDSARPLPGSLGANLALTANYGVPVSQDNTLSVLTDFSFEATAGTTRTRVYLNFTTEVGKSYFFSDNPLAQVGTLTRFARGGSNGAGDILESTTSDGVIFTATTTNSCILWDQTSGDFDVNSISVKEIDFTQGILFDGIAQFLKTEAFTLNQPTTVYLLAKQITWTATDTIFDGNVTNSGRLLQQGTTPNLRMQAGANGADNNNLALDTYGVVTVVFDHVNNNGLLQINNGAPSTDISFGTNDMGGFTLGSSDGAGEWANIQVKEALIYSAALDAQQIAKNINYLSKLGML